MEHVFALPGRVEITKDNENTHPPNPTEMDVRR